MGDGVRSQPTYLWIQWEALSQRYQAKSDRMGHCFPSVACVRVLHTHTHTLHFCLLFLSSSRKPMRSEFLVHKVYKVCNRFQHTHTKPNYEKNAWISPVNVKLLFQIAETSWRQNLNPSNPVFSAECCLTPSTLQTSSSCGLHLDVRTQGDVGNRKWKDWVFFFFFIPNLLICGLITQGNQSQTET